MTKVEIFTDGACRGNPGPGGWGALLRYKDHEKYLKGSESHTTNNRMELMGAIAALQALKHPCEIELTTDSIYLRDGITKWLINWKQNGWRGSKKKPIKNQDLWLKLEEAVAKHKVTWHWIKGHSGHRENEIADRLANEAIDELIAQQF